MELDGHEANGRPSALRASPPLPPLYEPLVRKIRPAAVRRSKRASGGLSYKLNLAEVQRSRLEELRHVLVRDMVKIQARGGGILDDTLANHLREYVQSLQEYDYMVECKGRSRDPFLLNGRDADRRTMFDVIMAEFPPGDLARAFPENQEVDLELGWETPKPDGRGGDQPRGLSKTVAFGRRLFTAAFGAAFLIGPMWLMMLRTELHSKLVSTTVFVSIFGVLMACFLKEHKDVLSSTAAYAAVLVVFVGLSSPASV